MDIISLLAPGNVSLASTIALYSFVIAAGIWLGKIKIGGYIRSFRRHHHGALRIYRRRKCPEVCA